VFLNGCGESQHQKIWSPKHDFPVIFGFFLLQNVENNLNALYRFPDSFLVAITESVQHRINLKMLFFIFSFSSDSSTYFCQYVCFRFNFVSKFTEEKRSFQRSFFNLFLKTVVHVILYKYFIAVLFFST